MAHLSDEEKRKANAEWFAAMNGAHLQPDTSKHPAMHRSPTTDYIILLSGEITLMLDKEERTLKPLDCVIQRGTNHAWINRGSEPALLMAVLADDRRYLWSDDHNVWDCYRRLPQLLNRGLVFMGRRSPPSTGLTTR